MNWEQDIRWQQRLERLEKAFLEFEEANHQKTYSTLERSGLIQTFEFTFELSWKTMQDLLLSRGYIDAKGPRPVIQQAFSDGIVDDGENWLKMLLSRNLIIHTYNEEAAEELKNLIKDMFFPLIKNLSIYLKKAVK